MKTDFQHFYVPPEQISADSFVLTGDEYKHAVKVLRKKKGDKIAAIDGCGGWYAGVIRHIGNNSVVVSIDLVEKGIGEPRVHLTIVQAIAKGATFDLMVEKGTEIGVSVFQPILTQRCIVDPTSRIERWRHKALAATKQCGRSRCPEIKAPEGFAHLLARNKFDLFFIAHEKMAAAANFPAEAVRNAQTVAVCIGPEGGFTEAEIRMAIDFGLIPLHFGERRLRSETAALVAATKIMGAAGELG